MGQRAAAVAANAVVEEVAEMSEKIRGGCVGLLSPSQQRTPKAPDKCKVATWRA